MRLIRHFRCVLFVLGFVVVATGHAHADWNRA